MYYDFVDTCLMREVVWVEWVHVSDDHYVGVIEGHGRTKFHVDEKNRTIAFDSPGQYFMEPCPENVNPFEYAVAIFAQLLPRTPPYITANLMKGTPAIEPPLF